MAAKLPLALKKKNEALEDASLVYKMMETCNKMIHNKILETTEDVIQSLFEYCSFLKNPFLIYPNLRKEYRNFVLNVISIFPSLKEMGLNSLYRILDFRNDYYYIK
jgi:hypothetical protein